MKIRYGDNSIIYFVAACMFILLAGSCGSEINEPERSKRSDDNILLQEKKDSMKCVPDTTIAWGSQYNSLSVGLTAGLDGKLDVCFYNPGKIPVTFWSYVYVGGDMKHYDWYKLNLTSVETNKKYEMVFLEGRGISGPVSDTLAPCGVIRNSIDIEFWRNFSVNKKERIPAGVYNVFVAYENPGQDKDLWSGKIESGTIKIQLK